MAQILSGVVNFKSHMNVAKFTTLTRIGYSVMWSVMSCVVSSGVSSVVNDVSFWESSSKSSSDSDSSIGIMVALRFGLTTECLTMWTTR